MAKDEELVMLISRCNYPVRIKYDGVEFILAPKAKTKREFIKSKLGTINSKEVMCTR